MQYIVGQDPTGEMTIGLIFAIVIILYVIFGGEEEKH